MSANLATIYQPKVSERLVAGTVIGGLTNQAYKFVGGKSIVIYDVDTMPLNDYQRTDGNNRFGNAQNIGTGEQTFDLEEDKSFTGVIDTLDDQQQMNVLKPGAILARQLREKIVPYVDAYVLTVLDTACAANSGDDVVADAASSAANAWSNFLALRSFMIDNEGPENGYRAVATSAYYNYLKQSGFVTTGDMAQKLLQRGFLGNVDGTPIKLSPSGRMATNVDLVITHPMVTTFAQVLRKFKVVPDPWGIDGKGIQGRLAFDAFVDNNKVDLIVEHKVA